MRRPLSPLLGAIFLASALCAGLFFARPEPENIFDYAFEVMSLNQLEACPGFATQYGLMLANSGELQPATSAERQMLVDNWGRFIQSERGEAPEACTWTIEPYPVAFIAKGPHTVIVINTSNTVVGAPLPTGTTGDLVMDATRYSAKSLGAFRGAATIPPRSIAVISLR